MSAYPVAPAVPEPAGLPAAFHGREGTRVSILWGAIRSAGAGAEVERAVDRSECCISAR